MSDRPDFWTFTFSIDPALNEGASRAFNQGGEPWWWFEFPCELTSSASLAAGGPPNMTGAKCIAVHNWEAAIWEAPA